MTAATRKAADTQATAAPLALAAGGDTDLMAEFPVDLALDDLAVLAGNLSR